MDNNNAFKENEYVKKASENVEKYRIYRQMITKMELELSRRLRLPNNYRKMYIVYRGEVMELMAEWVRNGVVEDEMNELLGDIIGLTDTMRIRLRGLLKN